MNSVLDHYIKSELLKTLSGVAIVLYLIFLSNQVVRLLGDVASGELPGSYLFILTLLASIRYLIILTPLAFYLSILLLFGRLYRDHEMASLSACGVGSGRLYRPIFKIAVPLAIVIAFLSFYLVPWAVNYESNLENRLAKTMEFTGISPGKFHSVGSRIIYLESMSVDRTEMQNVFIMTQYKNRPIMMVAEKAYMELDNEVADKMLVLLNGSRYEGEPGTTDYRQMKFTKHSIRVAASDKKTGPSSVEAMSTVDLLGENTTEAWAELQWRFAIPLSILILAFLAVPLSRISPRQGQFGKLFVGVLIYVIYVNLIAVSRAWTISEKLPLYAGINWVHMMILFLTVLILLKQYGWFWMKKVMMGKGLKA
jgi:lipopolysaccharide export system permease protein